MVAAILPLAATNYREATQTHQFRRVQVGSDAGCPVAARMFGVDQLGEKLMAREVMRA